MDQLLARLFFFSGQKSFEGTRKTEVQYSNWAMVNERSD
jgi:hypothetical protein